MKIRLITVGKKPEPWLNQALNSYLKRLGGQFSTELEIIPSSRQQGRTAINDESEKLLRRVNDRDFVILLDERGSNISSPELSQLITKTVDRPIVMIIGGAYGVDNRLHERADFVWSLSRLVFPHQIVRLITVEQIYRAQEIQKNSKYHHQ